MSRLSPALLLLTACPGERDDSGGAIALTLLSPADGAVVCGDPLVVDTRIENFTLTNETMEDAPDDVGHLHVYINGQEVAQADREHVEVTGQPDGEAQLRVDLALANHEALDPYVGTTIYITIDDTLCTE
jgi:hypothetical protein